MCVARPIITTHHRERSARVTSTNEGGEALPDLATLEKERTDLLFNEAAGPAVAQAHWYVLWTRSHCEQLVLNQLASKGFRLFFPRVEAWWRRFGVRHRISVPMFPGYVFLNHALDRHSHLEILKARGLVRILDEAGRPATVPDSEIEAIQRIQDAQLPARSHPYLREGQRVRVIGGPLLGVEGLLVKIKSKKGLLILSVNVMQRSMAVEVDCTLVEPLGGVEAKVGGPT